MVRVLIEMRAAALRNTRRSRFGTLALAVGSPAGLAVAISTLVLGWTGGRTAGVADEIALSTMTWCLGSMGFAAFAAGDPAVPLDLFRIVPVRPRRLARSLLALSLVDPSLIFVAIAFAALIVLGFRHGPVAGAVAVIGTAGMLVLVTFTGLVLATPATGVVSARGALRRSAQHCRTRGEPLPGSLAVGARPTAAMLGAAAGVIPVVSLIAVQPLDDNGSPGPTSAVRHRAHP